MYSKFPSLQQLRGFFFRNIFFPTLASESLKPLEIASSKRVHAVARRYLSIYMKPTGDNVFSKLMRVSQVEDFYWRILVPQIWIRIIKKRNEILITYCLKKISPFRTWRNSFYIFYFFKFLISFVLVYISLLLFRPRNQNIFIKESVNGFRYIKILKKLEKKFDYASCSVGDALRHPLIFFSGRILFVGLYIPPVINLHSTSIKLNKIIFILTSFLHQKAKKFNYNEIHSYDKIATSFWFVHGRKNLTFYQHGVVGPSYFNVGNKELYSDLLEYVFVRRDLKSPDPKDNIVVPNKASNVVFFNEFHSNSFLQRRLMCRFLERGVNVYYKDRPKSDFYSVKNNVPGVIMIDDLCDIPEGSLCFIFHSSVIYEVPAHSYIILIDNFLFSQAEIDRKGWIEYDIQDCDAFKIATI